MTLDDALRLAGQVLADYEATGPGAVPGSEGAQSGRLAQAPRDLMVAAAAWSAAPGSGPSAEALNAAARQIATGVMRIEAEANRIDRATADLAAGPAAGRHRRGGGRGVLGRLGRGHGRRPVAGPGKAVLSADDAVTAFQAAADAAAWHARHGDCAGCVVSGTCADPAAHQALPDRYAELRWRLRASLPGDRP